MLLLADLGNLVLIHHLARALHGEARAEWVAWAYALMPAPLVLSGWTFDGLTAFWMLLALWALVKRRDALGAAAIGLGAVTKLVPLLVLPVVWRARGWRRAAAMTAGAAATAALVLAPFALRVPRVVAASLLAQPAKASYATVWAMVDGNLRTAAGEPITGNFGPPGEHFDLAAATRPVHNPARVPGWVTLLALAPLYGWVWRRAGAGAAEGGAEGRRWTALLGFTWALFLLWSKGWSPQWQHMLVPLFLLIHPNREGVLLALVLAAVSFLEWPVLLSRGLASGYLLTIPLRTGLFVVWGATLGARLAGREAAGAPA
jgi:hypothetical protein